MTQVQAQRTSFGSDAGKLLTVLFILGIFVSWCGYWGFWAVTLVFYLTEKDSPYFRKMCCQLTALLFVRSIACWLLDIPQKIAQTRSAWATLTQYGAYDLFDLMDGLGKFVTYTAQGVVGTVFSALSALVTIGALVLLIMGAVRARKNLEWDIPLFSGLARRIDAKLHGGRASY